MELAGFGAALVIGASWMLKFIMGRLSKLEDHYRILVENHLVHSTQALMAVEKAIRELTEEMRHRGS